MQGPRPTAMGACSGARRGRRSAASRCRSTTRGTRGTTTRRCPSGGSTACSPSTASRSPGASRRRGGSPWVHSFGNDYDSIRTSLLHIYISKKIIFCLRFVIANVITNRRGGHPLATLAISGFQPDQEVNSRPPRQSTVTSVVTSHIRGYKLWTT
ncbi:uncharacterized protein M6B38_405800 [Iris pallida]|uniref:Uncharacterized protein n=1 Tax=Iris pallida TaxID=29817 RepID=A0AAX6FQ07_IRIPA|nr:uncharacterized protein M6B38_405800 [Iris pallida]